MVRCVQIHKYCHQLSRDQSVPLRLPDQGHRLKQQNDDLRLEALAENDGDVGRTKKRMMQLPSGEAVKVSEKSG